MRGRLPVEAMQDCRFASQVMEELAASRERIPSSDRVEQRARRNRQFENAAMHVMKGVNQ
jgi:hypothetical protein